MTLNKAETVDKLRALHASGLITRLDIERYSAKISKYAGPRNSGRLFRKIACSPKLTIYHPSGKRYLIMRTTGLLWIIHDDPLNGYIVESVEAIKAPMIGLVRTTVALLTRLLRWTEEGRRVGLGLHPARDFAVSGRGELRIVVEDSRVPKRFSTRIATLPFSEVVAPTLN